MVEETLFLAARNSCGQQLCAVQGHHKTRQTKPSGLPASIVESLASRYLASAPPRRCIGRPRKRHHPDDSDPQRLNQQLHLLDKHVQFHDCVVCSSRSTQRHRTQFFVKHAVILLCYALTHALNGTTLCHTSDHS